MTCRSEEDSGAHVLPCPPPPEPPLPPPPEECPPKGGDDGDGVDGDGDGVADGGRGGGVGAGRGGVGAAGAAVGGIAGRGGGAIAGRGGGGGGAGRAIGGGACRAIAGGAVGRGGIGGGAAGFATAGFGAGFGAATAFGFAAVVFLRAFTAGLRFAADLRADDALRAADLRAGFRFAIFFRAEALADFGLRDAAARFVFLDFLDLVAFAMIDLPVLLATHFKRIGILSGSAHLFLIRSEPLRARQLSLKTYQPIFLRHCSARKRRNHRKVAVSQANRHRSAGRPVDEFDRMQNGNRCTGCNLGDASNVAGRNNVRFQLFDIGELARAQPQRQGRLQHVVSASRTTTKVAFGDLLDAEAQAGQQLSGFARDLLPMLERACPVIGNDQRARLGCL
jgi:hypothetical protein